LKQKFQKGYVEKCPSDDVDVEINKACILFKVCFIIKISENRFNFSFLNFKEGKFDEALEKFNKASQIVGSRPGL
jgi:hypothetical protein